MKKYLTLIPLLFSLGLQAADKGGFKQDTAPPAPQEQKDGYRGVTDGQHQMMSDELAKLPEKSWVSLKGNILKRTAANHYLLRDARGTIAVIINDNVWRGQQVKPDDLVSLNGQLERNKGKVQVNVMQLRRL